MEAPETQEPEWLLKLLAGIAWGAMMAALGGMIGWIWAIQTFPPAKDSPPEILRVILVLGLIRIGAIAGLIVGLVLALFYWLLGQPRGAFSRVLAATFGLDVVAALVLFIATR